MADIRIDIVGAAEFEKALLDAAKQFPHSTEKIMEKETRIIKKQVVNSYVGSTIKSKRKNWKRSLKRKPKTALEKSFSEGRVIKHGNKYTCAVLSKAPHYHLVEDGHEEGGWYAKQENAKPIKGKKIVAKIMARRSKHSGEIAERILNDILKDAGLE